MINASCRRPSPEQIKQIGQALEYGRSRPYVDRAADGRQVKEAHNQVWMSDPRQTIYQDSVHRLPPTVAVSEDGQRVYFQRTQRGQAGAELVTCSVSRQNGASAPATVCQLPGQAVALDTTADGAAVAVALGSEVWTWRCEQGLQPLVTLSDKVRDVAFLDDGSVVAACGYAETSKFYLVSAATSQAVEVTLDELTPAAYQQHLMHDLQALGGFSERPYEELLNFRDANPWLFREGRAVPHAALADPIGNQVAIASGQSAGSAVRLMDRQTGQVRVLGELPEKEPASLRFMWSEDGSHLAAWRPAALADVGSSQALLAEPTTVYVWNVQSGQLRILPEVPDLLVNPGSGSLNFTQPHTSLRHQIGLHEIADLESQDWYRRQLQSYLRTKTTGLLAGSTSGSSHAASGQVEKTEQFVSMGGVRVPVRGHAMPPIVGAAPSAAATPPTAPSAENTPLNADIMRRLQQLHQARVDQAEAAERAQELETDLEGWLQSNGFQH